MDPYSDQILGPSPYVEDCNPSYTRTEELEKRYRKLRKQVKDLRKSKKNNKKKSKKKLKKLFQMMEEDRQRIMKLENKRHNEKEGGSKENLEERVQVLELQLQQQQQQQQCLQDIMSNAFLKLLSSTSVPVNFLPSQKQAIIELPAPRDQ